MTDAPAPAVVHLPRSLVALFPGTEKRMPASGATVLANVDGDVDVRPGQRIGLTFDVNKGHLFLASGPRLGTSAPDS